MHAPYSGSKCKRTYPKRPAVAAGPSGFPTVCLLYPPRSRNTQLLPASQVKVSLHTSSLSLAWHPPSGALFSVPEPQKLLTPCTSVGTLGTSHTVPALPLAYHVLNPCCLLSVHDAWQAGSARVRIMYSVQVHEEGQGVGQGAFHTMPACHAACTKLTCTWPSISRLSCLDRSHRGFDACLPQGRRRAPHQQCQGPDGEAVGCAQGPQRISSH